MSKKEKLKIQIQSPEEKIWEGEADSVTSINSQGEFDILPEHANFMTIIENKPILVRNAKDTLTFNFYYCVLHNEANQVKIFAHI